jgi:hypothetical protein
MIIIITTPKNEIRIERPCVYNGNNTVVYAHTSVISNQPPTATRFCVVEWIVRSQKWFFFFHPSLHTRSYYNIIIYIYDIFFFSNICLNEIDTFGDGRRCETTLYHNMINIRVRARVWFGYLLLFERRNER